MNISFDCVLTTYNRPEITRAAVLSCLNQKRYLNRVIVVDDASTDDTADQLSSIADPRVCLVRREVNGGISAARRSGFVLATAPWIIGLDSDHELLEGGLEAIAKTIQANAGLSAFGFRYVWDKGGISPKSIPAEPVSYRRRIELLTTPGSIGQDYVSVVSTGIRERVSWADLRSCVGDTLYQLDLAAVAEVLYTETIVALQKTTAAWSNSRGTVSYIARRRASDAHGALCGLELIQKRHGEAIEKYNPAYARQLRREYIFYSMLQRESTYRARASALVRESGAAAWKSMGFRLGLLTPARLNILLYGVYLRLRNAELG